MANSPPPAAEVRRVPKAALSFNIGPLQFAAKGDNGQMPVTCRARSGQPIMHWYWGKVVHDMAGFQAAAPSIPLDYCHDDSQIIGYLDQFTPSNEGLDCAGQIVAFTDDDRASEVAFKAGRGVPYQASIFFDDQAVVIEQVGMGAKAPVNGYELEGPAMIFRQWMLRGVAACPYGYDVNTNTRLAAGSLAGEVNVSINQLSAPSEESPMASESKPTTAETHKGAEHSLSANTPPGAAAPIVAADGTSPADPRVEFQAKLTKFTEKFGAANGAQWAASGLSYEQALEKHAEQLTASDQALKAKLAEAETKLAAVHRGEEKPVTFAAGDKHAAGEGAGGTVNQLSAIGKFAAGLKMPK